MVAPGGGGVGELPLVFPLVVFTSVELEEGVEEVEVEVEEDEEEEEEGGKADTF